MTKLAPPSFDYRAAFVGPQAENADEIERLVLEVLRDHMMWRRNFPPEDPRLIAEWTRSERPYRETVARLRDALYSVLARLKRGAPLHSPRQLAHMVTDPSMPALVGYFAGLLYNQNNVVQEASPETVRCEREFMAALARMVGYPELVGETADPASAAPRSFGHLTSGGTSANMEVVWTLRNVRYFPLALRLAIAEHPELEDLGVGRLSLVVQSGQGGPLGEARSADLFNLPVHEIVRLKRETGLLLRSVNPMHAQRFRESLPTVRRLGLGMFSERYRDAFPRDPLPVPVLLISQAAHYCWEKAMDLTGLGSQNLHKIAVDGHIRLDPGALQEALVQFRNAGRPILGVVSICGTTETASVDPIDAVAQLQEQPALPAFWHHCDGAFGGYFTSILERSDGEVVSQSRLPRDHPSQSVSESVHAALAAVSRCDSLVLDPHKNGFLPYPSGAVLFREYSVRDAIAYDAPYLAGHAEAGFGGFLGRWTLEGSRPGAAAVAGFLAQEVVPLTPEGHGAVLAQCLDAHRSIFRGLQGASGRNGIRFIPFGGGPDTTGSCFLLLPESATSTADEANRLTRAIWEAFTVDESGWNVRRNDFLISKSEVDLRSYPSASTAMFGRAFTGPDPKMLTLLRILTANPFLGEHTREDRVGEFLEQMLTRLYDVASHVNAAAAPADHRSNQI